MRTDETAMSVPQVLRTTKQTGGLHASSITRLQKRLDDLSSKQEKLVDNREQLLVDREAALMARKKIQQERTRAVDTEIALLDILRKHFNALRRPLPDDLLLAYEEVEKYHLRLRLLEDENLQTEEDLGTSEWEFNEQETELYQYHLEDLFSEELAMEGEEDILADPIPSRNPVKTIPPTPRIQYEAILADHGRLMKRFDTLRKQQILRMNTFTDSEISWIRVAEDTQMDSEATKLSGDLLDLMAQCEIQLGQLRPDLDLGASAKSERKRQSSEPDMNRDSIYERIETTSRANSEGAISPYDDYIHVDKNISEWSLQSLKCSALEKLQYLNFLRPKIVQEDALEQGFEHWEPFITRFWANEDEHSLTLPRRGFPVNVSDLGDQIVTTATVRERDQLNEFPESQEDSPLSSYARSLIYPDATDSLCSIENGVDTETTFDQGSQNFPEQTDQPDSGLPDATPTIVQSATVPEYRAKIIEDSQVLTLDGLLNMDYPSIDSVVSLCSCSTTPARRWEEVDNPLSIVPFLIPTHSNTLQHEHRLRVPVSIPQKFTAETGNSSLHASVTSNCSSEKRSKNSIVSGDGEKST
jgi:hypothetical protein